MQWFFDIVIAMMENAGFIRIGDVEVYLKNMIVIWSGAFADIPDGWALCDGTNGTPDLRLKFVFGANIPASVGVTGGTFDHDHDFAGDGHHHRLAPGTGVAGGTDIHDSTGDDPATGTTDLESTLPPYYVLAFIMKL